MTAREEVNLEAASFRPSVGRVLVGLIALGWLMLASPWPESLHGTGIVVILALAALNILLGIATRWLAFKPANRLDEREQEVRNCAYRIGFRLIAVGIMVMFALQLFGSIATSNDSMNHLAAVIPDGFSGRTIAAVLELLFTLPPAVIAWEQPELDLSTLSPNHFLPLAAVPILAAVWLGTVALAPVQLLTRVGSNGGLEEANASCEHYAGQQRVGLGFGGAARVGVEVCSNGLKAFVVGDPSLTPAGANLPVEANFVPRLGDLVSCTPYPGDSDFAAVSQQCTEQIDDVGTMHLVVRSTVSPLPGGIGARQLRMELVIDSWGRVISFQ